MYICVWVCMYVGVIYVHLSVCMSVGGCVYDVCALL